jgi:hypothetical protein
MWGGAYVPLGQCSAGGLSQELDVARIQCKVQHQPAFLACCCDQTGLCVRALVVAGGGCQQSAC